MKDLLDKIGIKEAGYFSSEDNYIIDFEDADAYNKAFAKLDNSSLIEENSDSSLITSNISNILYLNRDFSLNLIANFETDEYKLVVTELY